MIIGMEQFGHYFTDYKSSATRIETLPVYTVPDEKEELDLYLTGTPLPSDRNAEWAANIRSLVAEGKYMGRVHIIDHLLTPYLQFEIDWYYSINGAAGEDIRFIFSEDVPGLTYTDTWLFDDETVLDLSYDREGCLLYINENDHPDRLMQARSAWQEFHRRSFPLRELLVMIRNNDLQVPRPRSEHANRFRD
jgi:hypothetical protein